MDKGNRVTTGGYSVVGKRFNWAYTVLFAAAYIMSITLWTQDHVSLETLWLALAASPIVIYAIVDAIRFRIVITEDKIFRAGALNRIIDFRDVVTVLVTQTRTLVRSRKRTVRIDRFVENREELTREILLKVKACPGVRVTGDEVVIRKLLQ